MDENAGCTEEWPMKRLFENNVIRSNNLNYSTLCSDKYIHALFYGVGMESNEIKSGVIKKRHKLQRASLY